RKVGVVSEDGSTLKILSNCERMYELAQAAARSGTSIDALASRHIGPNTERYDDVISSGRLLPPLDHPDPHRCLITGTGLSHLGSAAARDSMHAKIQKDESTLTDSMKMFKWGIEGGKPPAGQIGTAPEWFYKGDGRCVVPPEAPLE